MQPEQEAEAALQLRGSQVGCGSSTVGIALSSSLTCDVALVHREASAVMRAPYLLLILAGSQVSRCV